MTSRFIIVGGGIAGLAAAIALRAPSREITVLEQSSQSREIGASISLQPNASKIVEQQWGLAERLAAKGAMVDEGFNIYSTDGKLQTSIPLRLKVEYKGQRIVYHRMDLHEVLKTRATSTEDFGEPATILLSSKVRDCDCAAGIVYLENGQILTGDVIIGADGIKSVIRKAVLGHEISPKPTGYSAYRVVVPTAELLKEKEFTEIIDPCASYTTMVMGYDRRIIMGPARDGNIYSVVAMVPDEFMNEPSASTSWTSQGDLGKMLQSYDLFPSWSKAPLRCAKEAGLWQLRDIDPLRTWIKGRTIIIGDAAHAMLPTQGQGASQSIEDAEALGAYFGDAEATSSVENIERCLTAVFNTRYERAKKIQEFSRQTARPATTKGQTAITMDTAQFMDYCCMYAGAKDWQKRMDEQRNNITVKV